MNLDALVGVDGICCLEKSIISWVMAAKRLTHCMWLLCVSIKLSLLCKNMVVL